MQHKGKFNMQKKRDSSHNKRTTRIGAQGFAIIGLLTLSPLLLTVLVLGGYFALIITQVTKAQSVCDNQHYHLQYNLANELNALLKLNPKALALRLKANTAKIRLAAATTSGNPAAIAAASAYSSQVYLQRLKLDQEQKQILLRARLLSSRTALTANYALSKYRPETKTNELAVTPDLPGDLAPLYIEKLQFQNAQKSQSRFYIKVAQHNFALSCAATIEKRGSHYFAALASSQI